MGNKLLENLIATIDYIATDWDAAISTEMQESFKSFRDRSKAYRDAKEYIEKIKGAE